MWLIFLVLILLILIVILFGYTYLQTQLASIVSPLNVEQLVSQLPSLKDQMNGDPAFLKQLETSVEKYAKYLVSTGKVSEKKLAYLKSSIIAFLVSMSSIQNWDVFLNEYYFKMN